MNEASARRYTLAQEIAPHYRANPKVRPVAALGSVAEARASFSLSERKGLVVGHL